VNNKIILRVCNSYFWLQKAHNHAWKAHGRACLQNYWTFED